MARSDASPARVYMDAVLTPAQSLSRRGLYVLLAILGVYNLLVMGFMLLIGAFPVPIFLGLDVVALLVAFRISNRRSLVAERVHVTAEQVRVSRGAPGREATVWSSPTAFTRVAVERGGEHEARVRLRLSGRGLSVGGSLSPEERTVFGQALDRAVRAATAERYPS